MSTGCVRSTRVTHLDMFFSVRWLSRRCPSGADDLNDVRMDVVRGLVVAQRRICGMWQDHGRKVIGVEGRGVHVLDWSLVTLGIGTADTLAAWGGGGGVCDAGDDAR